MAVAVAVCALLTSCATPPPPSVTVQLADGTTGSVVRASAALPPAAAATNAVEVVANVPDVATNTVPTNIVVTTGASTNVVSTNTLPLGPGSGTNAVEELVAPEAARAGYRWSRVAVQSYVANFDNNEDFASYELCLTRTLPWNGGDPEAWSWYSELDVTGGRFSGDDSDAFILTVGPRIGLQWRQGFLVDVGTRLTGFSEEVGTLSPLGGQVHFTSHIRTGFRVDWLEVGVRAQHTSNGGISAPNPGADLVVVDVGRRF